MKLQPCNNQGIVKMSYDKYRQRFGAYLCLPVTAYEAYLIWFECSKISMNEF